MNYYDLEAESALLGAVMIDDVLFKHIAHFTKEYFYEKNNQTIFDAMFTMNNNGEKIDSISLTTVLKNTDVQHDYIDKLFRDSSELINAEVYARIVKDCYLLRMIILQAKSAYDETKAACDYSTAYEQFVKHYDLVNDLMQLASGSETIESLSGKVCDASMAGTNRNDLISTNIFKLDNNAHLRKGGLYLLSGKSKSGKTTLMLNIARQHCKNAIRNKRDNTVVVFSLEMTKEELTRKLIAIESGVGELEIFTGVSKYNVQKVLDASAEVAKWNLIIETSCRTPQEIYARLKVLSQTVAISLAFADHYSALSMTGFFKSEIERNDTKAQMMADIPLRLRLCLVMIAHQKKSGQRYSKTDDDYEEPREEDIGGFGALERVISGQWVCYRKKDNRYLNIVYIYFFWWRHLRPALDYVELATDNVGYIGD